MKRKGRKQDWPEKAFKLWCRSDKLWPSWQVTPRKHLSLESLTSGRTASYFLSGPTGSSDTERILGKSASLQLELKDELCSLRLASKSFFEDLGGTSLWWPRCKCVSLYPHGLLSLNWLHSTFSVGKLSSPMYFVKKYCHSTTLSFLYPQCLYNHGDSLLSISKSLEKRIWLDQPSKRGREKRWV